MTGHPDARPPGSLKPATHGFTVLEMIVVIMISGLIIGVVFGAFGVLLQTQDRVGRVAYDLTGLVVERERVRQVMTGLFPGKPGDDNAVIGESRVISGRTQSPLLGWTGRPTPFELRLDYDLPSDSTRLLYKEEGRPPVVLMRLPGDRGAFSYSDENLNWMSSWPPFGGTDLMQPSVFRLSWGNRPDDVIVAYTAGFTDLPTNPVELGTFR